MLTRLDAVKVGDTTMYKTAEVAMRIYTIEQRMNFGCNMIAYERLAEAPRCCESLAKKCIDDNGLGCISVIIDSHDSADIYAAYTLLDHLEQDIEEWFPESAAEVL